MQGLCMPRKPTTTTKRKGFFRNVMVVRKPSSHFTASSTSSTDSSLKTTASAYTEEWDADDEDAMSADDRASSRPLSVAIPTVGPYCPRRPNLRDILANTAPAPWTLTAFMAYLSNNHCLETLEFTMDAGRYRKHYAKMMSRSPENGMPPAKDRDYVQALWERLVDAYIKPNGSREVNLPSSVRDPINNLSRSAMPPAPESLDPAVSKIYELMEDSVLVPFLNSMYPQSAHPTVQSCPFDPSEDSISVRSRRFDDRSPYNRRSRSVRSSPPLRTAVQPHPNSYSPQSNARRSAHIPLPTSPQKSRFTVSLNHTTSAPGAPLPGSQMGHGSLAAPEAQLSAFGSGLDYKAPGMTDDSGSASSPTNESPMTPPLSPPGSDQSVKRDSGMWKKLGRLSGMKVGKKKSQGGLQE